MDARQAATFLRAFGDGTRLRILAALARRQLTVGDLARLVAAPVHRISRHLRYLDGRGLVDCEAKRKSVVYRLTRPSGRLREGMVSALLRCVAEIEEVQRDGTVLGAEARGGVRKEGGVRSR
jgi:DNA-binding transcriptional ArsR family regulator